MTYPPPPPQGPHSHSSDPHLSGDRFGPGGSEHPHTQRPFPGYESHSGAHYGHAGQPQTPQHQPYGRYSHPSDQGNMAGFRASGPAKSGLNGLVKIGIIFGVASLGCLAGVIALRFMMADIVSNHSSDLFARSSIDTVDWYDKDWEWTFEDVREDREDEIHTVHLEIADSWNLDDCPEPLADGEDDAAFSECSISIGGHYEHPELDFEVCQRVYEFENTTGPAAVERAYDQEDLEPTDSTPMACQGHMEDMDQYLTRVRAHDEYVTVTIGGWNLSDPTEDEYYEILSATNYRHTEISNATMWMTP